MICQTTGIFLAILWNLHSPQGEYPQQIIRLGKPTSKPARMIKCLPNLHAIKQYRDIPSSDGVWRGEGGNLQPSALAITSCNCFAN